ncbi:hypothetical protein Bca4012_073992 [Brassica carinata]
MMNITAQETVLLKQCQGFLSRYCVEMTVSDDSAVFVGFAMQWRNIPASAVSQNVKAHYAFLTAKVHSSDPD